MQVARRLGNEFRQESSHAPDRFCLGRFIALLVRSQTDVVRFVGGEKEILPAHVGGQQVLNHPKE